MEQIVFTKAGIIELHATMHERLDLLLRRVATMADELWHKTILGFGHPSVQQQLVHILTCEEGWATICKISPLQVGMQKTAQRWRRCKRSKSEHGMRPELIGKSNGRAT